MITGVRWGVGVASRVTLPCRGTSDHTGAHTPCGSGRGSSCDLGLCPWGHFFLFYLHPAFTPPFFFFDKAPVLFLGPPLRENKAWKVLCVSVRVAWARRARARLPASAREGSVFPGRSHGEPVVSTHRAAGLPPWEPAALVPLPVTSRKQITAFELQW